MFDFKKMILSVLKKYKKFKTTKNNIYNTIMLNNRRVNNLYIFINYSFIYIHKAIFGFIIFLDFFQLLSPMSLAKDIFHSGKG